MRSPEGMTGVFLQLTDAEHTAINDITADEGSPSKTSRIGVPNLGCLYPSEGVHLCLEMEGKYINILFPNIYACISEYHLYSSKTLFYKNSVDFVIFFSLFVTRNARGTCSSLKC